MRPKILLTGKNGQIGRELHRLLPQLGEVVGFDRQELDLAKPEAIRQVVRDVRPSLIVNAAAYTAVDQAETEEASARAINAGAPAILAEEAAEIGSAIVHYSTDYVFDGSKCTPYTEDDTPNPINAYGRTKLAGEKAVREIGVPHLILRTGWVYSREGRNFPLSVLRLATQQKELRIVSDQVGAPTSSREIALATIEILGKIFAQHVIDPSRFDATGTYHMTASGETNWCEFANAILVEASRARQDVPWFVAATDAHQLVAQRAVAIRSDEYPTVARRPAYSVLSNSRLAQTFDVHLKDWRTQLRLLFSDV